MGPGGRLAALGPWSLLPPVPRGRRRSPPATAAAHGTRARAQVASFQCLQPFVGTLLAFAVLGEEPSAWDLGAVGVLLGLVLVVSDKHDLQARAPGLRVRVRTLLGLVLGVGDRRDLQARAAAPRPGPLPQSARRSLAASMDLEAGLAGACRTAAPWLAEACARKRSGSSWQGAEQPAYWPAAAGNQGRRGHGRRLAGRRTSGQCQPGQRKLGSVCPG